MFVFLLSLFCIKNVLSQPRAPPLGDCNPPSSGSGTECIWNCGHRLCEGVYYCGPNSTKCEVNCMIEGSCSDSLVVLSQSKGLTDVNCFAPQGSCNQLAVHCGDFDNNVLLSLLRNGFDGLRSAMHDYMSNIQGNMLLKSLYRPIQHYFTKKPGHYTKCSLNCAGAGDSCDSALLSCNGKFDTGCVVNAKKSTQGNIFKSGQFFCSIKNSKGETGSCLLNCPPNNPRVEMSCLETRYGCLRNTFGKQFPRAISLGLCYCQGPVCSHRSSKFLSRVVKSLPPKPTFRPTSAPTYSPSPFPTRNPTKSPTKATKSPSKAPIIPTRPTTPSPTSNPTPKPTNVPVSGPYLFDTTLEVFTKKDRKKFKGNVLKCDTISCEVKCLSKDTCSNLVLLISENVFKFKLTCEGRQSCVNLKVHVDAKESQLECKGVESCIGANFNFGSNLLSKTPSQKVELKCEEGSCSKGTVINCGHDVAECLLQNGGGKLNAFGGTLNCYSQNPNANCEMQCSSVKSELACIGSTFNCFTKKKKQCQCLHGATKLNPFHDCPKINYLQF